MRTHAGAYTHLRAHRTRAYSHKELNTLHTNTHILIDKTLTDSHIRHQRRAKTGDAKEKRGETKLRK